MSAPFVWNNGPFPPEAERLVLPDGRVLEDAVVWDGFMQEELGLDPAVIWDTISTLPTWPDDEPIPFRSQGGDPHWVNGAHPALNYRGHALRRGKIWLQRDYQRGLHRYGYTGWQHAISYATHAVESVPEMNDLLTRINAGLTASGQKAHNHMILTRYEAGEDNIGYHSDKDGDYAEDSYFLILKLGDARPFAFREVASRDDPKPEPFYFRALPAGTAIFVRAKGDEAANNLVQHAVPPTEDPVGPSGSIVTRCIETVRSWDQVARDIERARQAKTKREDKRQRARVATCPQELAVPSKHSEFSPPLINEASDPATAQGWTIEEVKRWAQSAEPHCRAAVRVLAATGLPIPINDLNAAVGACSGGPLIGGVQRWATTNELPHAFEKDEAGAYRFASDQVRLLFREVLCGMIEQP